MGSIQFTPVEACVQCATERKTVYALSVLNLFKSSFIPNPSSVKADYVAAVADYTTYAEETLTAWLGPILAPGSGAMIESPLVLFDTGATDPATGNVIGGSWLEDAAGKLRMCVIFDTPLPMQLAYQGIPISLVELFPTGN